MSQDGLHDGRFTTPHRCACLIEETGGEIAVGDAAEFKSARPEVLKVGSLVPKTPLSKDFERWVPDSWLSQLAHRDELVEIGKVPATQETDEVGCTEPNQPRLTLHTRSPHPRLRDNA